MESGLSNPPMCTWFTYSLMSSSEDGKYVFMTRNARYEKIWYSTKIQNLDLKGGLASGFKLKPLNRLKSGTSPVASKWTYFISSLYKL